MSQGLLDAQNGATPGGVSRRTFLKFGITVGATAAWWPVARLQSAGRESGATAGFLRH